MRARLDRLAKCDSEQARAKEHKAGCDYRWESIGHEVMIAHGRLPLGVLVTVSIVLRPLEQNDTRGGSSRRNRRKRAPQNRLVKPSPRAVSAQKNRVLGTSVMFS